MKCVYVGDFDKPYSSENYITHALRENGVEVVQVSERKITSVDSITIHRPDFVLFCKCRTPIDGYRLIKDLRFKKIPTVSWLFDLYFDLPRERGIMRTPFDPPFHTDIVFTTDGGHDYKWQEMGINHKLLRQGVHEPEAIIGQKLAGVSQIVFTGSVIFQGRVKLMEHMKERYGDKFSRYGHGGDKKEIRGLDLNDTFASTKIVLGDSQPWKNYWSNRIYEVLGRGGFLIHPKVEGLEKEFEYYKHFIPYTFGNYDELDEIIDYYLTHDEEREKIRLAGHEFVKKYYTYTLRVKELLHEIRTHWNLL